MWLRMLDYLIPLIFLVMQVYIAKVENLQCLAAGVHLNVYLNINVLQQPIAIV